MVNSMMMRTSLFLAAASLCVLCGCGNGNQLTTGSVTGTVSLDGKPLNDAEIVFYSDKRMGLGDIVNGDIVNVTTYTSNDGVLIGEHRVAVRPKIDEAELMRSPFESSPKKKKRKSKIPLKYQRADTSGLTAKIKAGENPISFELFSNK
jgi:hypothetical protein